MSGRNKAAASRVRKGCKSKRSLAGTGRPGDSGKSATKHPVPWSSALHLQPKPSRGVRLCGDFRDLNAKTVLDSFPLPNLRHFTHQLKSSNTFFKLDLVKVFPQIGLDKALRMKTAVKTPWGTYVLLQEACNGAVQLRPDVPTRG